MPPSLTVVAAASISIADHTSPAVQWTRVIVSRGRRVFRPAARHSNAVAVIRVCHLPDLATREASGPGEKSMSAGIHPEELGAQGFANRQERLRLLGKHILCHRPWGQPCRGDEKACFGERQTSDQLVS